MGAGISQPVAPLSGHEPAVEVQGNHVAPTNTDIIAADMFTTVGHEGQNSVHYIDQNSIVPHAEQNNITHHTLQGNGFRGLQRAVSERVVSDTESSPRQRSRSVSQAGSSPRRTGSQIESSPRAGVSDTEMSPRVAGPPIIVTPTVEVACAKYVPCVPTVNPDKISKITGCVYLSSGFLVLIDNRNKRIKLFDANLKCISFINLEHRPFEVCECNGQLYVTIPKEKEIQVITVSIPFLCVARKLILRTTLKTEGECYGITNYKNDLIVGVKFPPLPTDIADFSWQIHVMNTKGTVKQKIATDSRGRTLFSDAYFISMSHSKKELIVSEATEDRVKGYNMKKKKKIFNHKIEEPKGLAVDRNNNIYVLGKHASIHWIEPDRKHVHVLLQGMPGQPSSGENMTYNSKTNKLLVPRNENKVDIYRLKGKVT